MAAKKSVQLSGIVVAESAISSIDPDEGVLMYRGYDIADLAEHSTYEETALLLLDGELPSSERLAAFQNELAGRDLPAATAELVDRSASEAAPMDMLRTAVSTLSFDDPGRGKTDLASGRQTATRLIAELPTIVSRYHRRRQGLEPVPPDPTLSYAESFLTMLHGERPTEREVRAFDVAMILHAEHEMNASTFTARVVAGTGADLAAAVVAAIGALSGPLHGGANEAAMGMFERWGSPGTSRRTAASRTGTRSQRRASEPFSRRRASSRTSTSTRRPSIAISASPLTCSHRCSRPAGFPVGRRTSWSSEPTTGSFGRPRTTSAPPGASSRPASALELAPFSHPPCRCRGRRPGRVTPPQPGGTGAGAGAGQTACRSGRQCGRRP